MKRKLPHIDHSREELHQLLKAERDVQKRQRLQALYLLASRQAKTRLAVAELLGVHRHSVGTWLELYEQGGLEGLLTIKKAPGKKPLASPDVVAALQERLHHPKGLGPMARSKPTWPKHTRSRWRIPQCTLWYATAWAPNRSHPAGPIPKKP